MDARWIAPLCLVTLLVAAAPTSARVVAFDLPATALPGTSEGYLFEGSQVSGSDLGSEVVLAGPREEACAFCVKVTGQLAVVLADPETAAETIAIMQGAVCTQLPQELQKQCLQAVEEYVPQIFLSLQELLSTDTLCIATKVCVVDSNSLSQPMGLSHGPPLRTPQSCQVCLAIASEMLLLLQNGKTEEQILTGLHAACGKLKAPGVSEKCDAAVDAYVPQLITLLQTLSPKEVCTAIKSCPLSPLQKMRQWVVGAQQIVGGPQTLAHKVAMAQMYVGGGMETPQECAACRFLVSQAKKKLKDPTNQVKLTMMLSEACNKIPDYTDQCKAAVLQYLPLFFANLDTLVDPIRLCTQAKLCSAFGGVGDIPSVFQLPSAGVA